MPLGTWPRRPDLVRFVVIHLHGVLVLEYVAG